MVHCCAMTYDVPASCHAHIRVTSMCSTVTSQVEGLLRMSCLSFCACYCSVMDNNNFYMVPVSVRWRLFLCYFVVFVCMLCLVRYLSVINTSGID